MIDQDAAHRSRRDGEKMAAVFPAGGRLVGQAQVGFVDECRWLERVIGPLVPQRRGGEPAQFVVDEREHRAGTVGTSAASSAGGWGGPSGGY